MSSPKLHVSSGCGEEMVDFGFKEIVNSFEKYKLEDKFEIFNVCTDIKHNFDKKFGGKWSVIIYNTNYGNSTIDATAEYMKFVFRNYEIKIIKTGY